MLCIACVHYNCTLDFSANLDPSEQNWSLCFWTFWYFLGRDTEVYKTKDLFFIFLLIDKTWRFYLKYMICFQACNLIYRPQEETLKCSWASSFTLYASSLYIFDSWPTLIFISNYSQAGSVLPKCQCHRNRKFSGNIPRNKWSRQTDSKVLIDVALLYCFLSHG